MEALGALRKMTMMKMTIQDNREWKMKWLDATCLL